MKHDNMKPTRDWLLYAHLQGPRVSDRSAAKVVERMLENDGAIDSSNMHGLAVVAGYQMDILHSDDVRAWIAADLRCSWFYDKATGIKNAQATWSHGALEELPFLIAYKIGFEEAAANIGSRVRYVRSVDRFRTGFCRTAGARSPRRLQGSDYLDYVAQALLGKQFRPSANPNAQDAKFLLQQLFPDLHALADASPDVRWYEPVTNQWTETVLLSMANLPRKKSIEATWLIASDRTGEILLRNEEKIALKEGAILGSFTTPPRIEESA